MKVNYVIREDFKNYYPVNRSNKKWSLVKCSFGYINGGVTEVIATGSVEDCQKMANKIGVEVRVIKPTLSN